MVDITIVDVKQNNSSKEIYSYYTMYYSSLIDARILLDYFIDNDVAYFHIKEKNEFKVFTINNPILIRVEEFYFDFLFEQYKDEFKKMISKNTLLNVYNPFKNYDDVFGMISRTGLVMYLLSFYNINKIYYFMSDKIRKILSKKV